MYFNDLKTGKRIDIIWVHRNPNTHVYVQYKGGYLVLPPEDYHLIKFDKDE